MTWFSAVSTWLYAMFLPCTYRFLCLTLSLVIWQLVNLQFCIAHNCQPLWFWWNFFPLFISNYAIPIIIPFILLFIVHYWMHMKARLWIASPRPHWGSLQNSPRPYWGSLQNSPWPHWGSLQNSPRPHWGSLRNSPRPHLCSLQNSPRPHWGSLQNSPRLYS